LTVHEVAVLWGVTDHHVVNLIEEGQLAAIDVSARHGCFPMPKAALAQLAARLKVTPEQLLEFIRTITPAGNQGGRALWRIPVVEGYLAFMKQRHSLR